MQAQQRLDKIETMSLDKNDAIMLKENDKGNADSSSEDELQVVSEHINPNAANHISQQAIDLPANLQAKLLAAMRASNIHLPDGASKIKIITKNPSEGTSASNCSVIMPQNGESSSRSRFSIPFAELNQATPSTSKGSRVADLNTPLPWS